jgi:DNA-binding CsgD family transcriptional regulator
MSAHRTRATELPSLVLDCAAFEGMSVPVHIIGRSGTVHFTNEQGVSFIWGDTYTREQIIGRTLMELGPRNYYAERIAFLAKVIDANRVGIIRSLRHGQQTYVHIHPVQKCAIAEPAALVMIERRATPLSGDELAGIEYLNPVTQDLGPLSRLSTRELEVLAYVGMGLSVEETAGKLHRSRETVISHRKALMRKLGCATASHLAVMATNAALTPWDAARMKHVEMHAQRTAEIEPA